MEFDIIKVADVPKKFRSRSKSFGQYDDLAKQVSELKKGEALRVYCDTVKPHSIFCGIRTKLKEMGIYDKYTSMREDDYLYITCKEE